ncbi:hypothetical protein QYS49_33750 [Marivirga salinae]|uniref:Uncharacterized protein n=1 Tax=Marivirga salinarum TaxID=3059078 RepID=A0AA51REH6_9BACT|nr:hypothetical protein [Marivirga sp. BDSF4-3]WMN12494.1 hypothetical protein QYS49_33750 [Marivirga sp. BDSF4-3]
MKKTWLIVSLVNFLIASLMGLLLRGAFVWEIDWLDYRNMLHGHSHVALLGWLYLGFFIVIHAKLLPKEKADKPIYTWLFWLTQFTVLGMAIAFPIQGYAVFSIFFSTLHIVLSYIFAVRVWKDHSRKDFKSSLLLRTAILFLFISTVGVFVVAYIMASKNGANVIYQIAIQFYLHFQFNGWLLFALLALFFNRFGNILKISNKAFKQFYWLLLLGNILSYALVLYWGYRWEFSYYVNAVAVVLQLLAVLALIKSFGSSWIQLKNSLSAAQKLLLKLLITVFLTRTIFQFALVIPEMAEMAVLLRLFIIGFIHLNMLGFFTAYIWLEYLFDYKSAINTLQKSAVILLLIGFLLTELIMFLQGFFYWQELGKFPYFHEGLFYASCILPIAILTFLRAFAKKGKFQIATNH